MAQELRIYRASPFDQKAQRFLVPPKSIEAPDLSDLSGPKAFFYLAEREDQPLGCISLRNMGSFGLVSALHFIPEQEHTALPDILIEQVETQARSLRLPVLRAWVGRLHPSIQAAFTRNGFFPDCAANDDDRMAIYERHLKRGAARASAKRPSV
ncbi:hypothetical protein [Tropicimonas sp. S265A]|uniref:hypothetical protein n=1 Tax=Tropicimonas sp. S265A TaxID=3415134 RepID=UPI003C7AFDA0